MATTLITDLLAVLDTLSGGVQAGFRPVHAKGTMYAGMFVPAAGAADLTRAPHAGRPSTPITVRFSTSSGIPTAADNDPNGSSPQAMAVRFHLADHVHTDIIAHSHNGFPVRTGEEFLEFFRAIVASGPGAPTPPPIAAFLEGHPAAKAFVEAPKPIPVSFARQAYFAVNAFRFTNAQGVSRFGRFRIAPAALTSNFMEMLPASMLNCAARISTVDWNMQYIFLMRTAMSVVSAVLGSLGVFFLFESFWDPHLASEALVLLGAATAIVHFSEA